VWNENDAVVVAVVPGSVKIAKVPASVSWLITNAAEVPTVTVGWADSGVADEDVVL
jgi:methyl coenzyme M reductase subunit C